jgi:hypothetical protein
MVAAARSLSSPFNAAKRECSADGAIQLRAQTLANVNPSRLKV